MEIKSIVFCNIIVSDAMVEYDWESDFLLMSVQCSEILVCNFLLFNLYKASQSWHNILYTTSWYNTVLIYPFHD